MRQENESPRRAIERPSIADRGGKSQSAGGFDFLKVDDLVLVGCQCGEHSCFAGLGSNFFENGAGDSRKRSACDDLMREKVAFRAEFVHGSALRNVTGLA